MPNFATKQLATGAYTWAFPGSPVQIQLRLEVVEQLADELKRAANGRDQMGEIGGLLLGSVAAQRNSIDIINITPFRSGQSSGSRYVLQQSDRKRLREAKAESKSVPGAALILGYYRTHLRPNLFLDEDDIALMRECFPEPYSVALLIKRSVVGSPVAGFFFWDKGEINSEFSFLEFPLDTLELSASTSSLLKPQVVPENNYRLPGAARPAWSFRNWGAMLRSGKAWALAAVVLAIGLPVFQYRKVLSDKFQPPANRTEPAAVKPAGLQIQTRGTDLHVSWNRTGPVIDRAKVGILSIFDGEVERKVYLDSVQLRSGSAMYSPKTESVRFRLEILSPTGESADEQVVAVVPLEALHKAVNSPQTRLVSENRLRFPEPPATTNGPKMNTAPLEQKPSPSQPPRGFEAGALPPRTTPARLSGALTEPEPPPVLTANPLSSSSVHLLDTLPSPAPAPYAPPPESASAAPHETRPVQQPTADARAYVPPQPLTQTPPSISRNVRAMLTREIYVDVRVNLDATGRVISAKAEASDGPMAGFFIAPAVEAARRWKFQPGRLGNRNVPADIVVRFKFSPTR